jgi:hypothetical protein
MVQAFGGFVTSERRVTERRSASRRGGRRSTDRRPPGAVAAAGAGLPDRVAHLEGAVDAAWDTLDGFFTRSRSTQAEISEIRDRLAQLTDVLQALTAAMRKNS